MILRLNLDEVKDAVILYLAKRGLTVTRDNINQHTHTEGQYEDSREMFDGLDVDVSTVIKAVDTRE